jgi:hypothetical protein
MTGALRAFSGYAAVIPVVCVWLGGIASMLAEAFREPDERMPIGGLGIIGVVASMIAALLYGIAARRATASSWRTISACSSRSCWGSWASSPSPSPVRS